MSRPIKVAFRIKRDALGQPRGVVQTGHADVAEQGHHAGDGADEAEQRRDADDDFEHDQAAFEPDDFMARGGLQRVHVVRLRPVEVVGGQQQQASERRRFPAADVASALWCRRGSGRPSSAAAISGGTTLFQRNASARSTMNVRPTTEVNPSKM